MQRYQLWTLVDRFQSWAPNTNASDDYVLHSDAEREIEALKDELAALCAHRDSLEAEIAAAEQRGRQKERAEVVAWQRREAARFPGSMSSDIMLNTADALERGDHHAHGREAQP